MANEITHGKEAACKAGDPDSLWNPLKKGMAIYSCILAYKIPQTEKPVAREVWLQSVKLERVDHDWATNIFTFKKNIGRKRPRTKARKKLKFKGWVEEAKFENRKKTVETAYHRIRGGKNIESSGHLCQRIRSISQRLFQGIILPWNTIWKKILWATKWEKCWSLLTFLAESHNNLAY